MRTILLLLCFVCLHSTSATCQIFGQGKKQYKSIIDNWDIEAYSLFKTKYPTSKYNWEIDRRLLCKKRNDLFKAINVSIDTLEISRHISMFDTCLYCKNYLPNNSLPWLGNEKADITALNRRLDSLICQYFWNDYVLKDTGNEYAVFEKFRARFPTSHLIQRANDSIQTRKDRFFWNNAIKLNSALGYRIYLDSIPDGKHSAEASSLYNDHKLGETILEQNSHAELVVGLRKLRSKKVYSKYTEPILNKIKLLEEEDYRLCESKKSLKDWFEFERQYAGGYFFADVDKKIRSMCKIKPTENRSQYGTYVEMENKKPHTITFEYTRGNSKPIIIHVKVGNSETSIIPNGQYKLRILNASDNSEIISEPVTLVGQPQTFSCCSKIPIPQP